MEWVETTGRTVEEAKELALDHLGVDSGDAEFDVVEEPKVGLFGRTRGVARVRARVLPKSPRAKVERRRRPKKSDGKGGERSTGSGEASSGQAASGGRQRQQGDRNGAGRGAAGAGQRAKDSTDQPARDQPAAAPERSSGRAGREPREAMDMDEQKRVLTSFVEELARSFGLTATAEATVAEDELTVNLTGGDLGLLVGPRLATLDAVQEIARNTLQRHAEGREYARVVVDVEGIRQRRREALREFVTAAAAQVRDEDVTVVFEVMSSVDRKMVHDVTGELEGVVSVSEGEDPRRRVVLRKG